MFLAIDIGNTNITLGFYTEDKIECTSRMYTARKKSCDEYSSQIASILSMHNIKGSDINEVAISSVVPEITDEIFAAIQSITGVTPVLIGENYHGKLKCEVFPLKYLGADLISCCVGVINKYPLPAVIVDMGTATKIIAVNSEGYFIGCSIAPGIKISLSALSNGASLLPNISFEMPKKVIGTNTVECMQSGSVIGNACMIDGMTERFIEEAGFKNPTLVATGGYVKGILNACKTDFIYDENLVLDGILHSVK